MTLFPTISAAGPRHGDLKRSSGLEALYVAAADRFHDPIVDVAEEGSRPAPAGQMATDGDLQAGGVKQASQLLSTAQARGIERVGGQEDALSAQFAIAAQRAAPPGEASAEDGQAGKPFRSSEEDFPRQAAAVPRTGEKDPFGMDVKILPQAAHARMEIVFKQKPHPLRARPAIPGRRVGVAVRLLVGRRGAARGEPEVVSHADVRQHVDDVAFAAPRVVQPDDERVSVIRFVVFGDENAARPDGRSRPRADALQRAAVGRKDHLRRGIAVGRGPVGVAGRLFFRSIRFARSERS